MGKQRGEHGTDPAGQRSNKKDGRIGRLDENTLGYYRRVQETLNDEFSGEEEKALFLDNVFKQLSEEAIRVSQSQTASGIVETLLQQANSSQCLLILKAFSADWELACTDRFACYVTQTLLMTSWKYIPVTENHSEDTAEDESQLICDKVLELCGMVMSQLAPWMQHMYASHIIRTLLEVMGGSPVSEKVIRSKLSRKQARGGKDERIASRYRMCPRLKKPFYRICESIVNLKRLPDHVKNYLSNPVLQTMVLVTKAKHPDILEGMCTQLLDHISLFDTSTRDQESGLPELVTHEIGSHFLEQLFTVLPPDLYTNTLQQLEDSLQPMALHPTANFVLKQLILNAPTKEQFEGLMENLGGSLEDMMGLNHFGVVTALAQGCITHRTKQKKFIKTLQKTFHCYKPEERQSSLAPLVLSLSTYEVYHNIPDEKASEDGNEQSTEPKQPSPDKPSRAGGLSSINLHGSILVQHLLKFANATPVVSSLLALDTGDLVTLASDPCGSHALDAFMHSDTVGEKSRDALFTKLKGAYTTIACSKNGSRTLDTLWAVTPLKWKTTIATELSKQEARIRGDRFGHHVWRNCALTNFQLRREEWKQLQSGNIKKRKMFEDIIGDTTVKRKKKKPEADSEDLSGRALLLEDDEDTPDLSCHGSAISSTKEIVSSHDTTDDESTPSPTQIKKKQTKGKKKQKKDKISQQAVESTVGLADKVKKMQEEILKKKNKKKKVE